MAPTGWAFKLGVQNECSRYATNNDTPRTDHAESRKIPVSQKKSSASTRAREIETRKSGVGTRESGVVSREHEKGVMAEVASAPSCTPNIRPPRTIADALRHASGIASGVESSMARNNRRRRSRAGVSARSQVRPHDATSRSARGASCCDRRRGSSLRRRRLGTSP